MLLHIYKNQIFRQFEIDMKIFYRVNNLILDLHCLRNACLFDTPCCDHTSLHPILHGSFLTSDAQFPNIAFRVTATYINE